jgi:uncharacterized protein YbcV (DUF1398 family)
MICALIRENIVVEVKNLTDEEITAIGNQYEAIIDCTNLTPVPQVGWTFDGHTISGTVQSYHLTKLKFRQRFTTAEMAGIFAAAQSNYILQVLLDNQRVSNYADLGDPSLIAGMQYLVSLNLISSARYTEILTTPPTASELYHE